MASDQENMRAEAVAATTGRDVDGAFQTFLDPELRHPTVYNGSNQYVARSRKRVESTYELLRDVIPERSVLDIGASPFYFLWLCRRYGATRAAGVFFSNDQHPLVQSDYLHTNAGEIELAHRDALNERLPWSNSTFDVVTVFEVFEHFPVYPALLLSEITRVLKPSGTLAVTVPNACSMQKVAKILLNRNPFMKYRPDPTGRHVHEYTDHQLRALMRAANCSVDGLRFIQYSTSHLKAFQSASLRSLLSLPGMLRFRPVIFARGRCRGYVPLEHVEYASELFDGQQSVEV